MDNISLYFDFLNEYAAFLEHMVSEQQDKLNVVLSNNLNALEHSISIQQATSMRLDLMEKKRTKLHCDAGFGDMTLLEVIDSLQDTQQDGLKKLHSRIVDAVDQIKFLNTKSCDTVQFKLDDLTRCVFQNPVPSTGYGYTKNSQIPSETKKTFLQTKI